MTDCYVRVGDGWGQAEPPGPKVVVPHREFWLFRGSLSGLASPPGPGSPAGLGSLAGLGGGPPAFVWPVDRAWCFAHDVDPQIARLPACGIGDDDVEARIADEPADQPGRR